MNLDWKRLYLIIHLEKHRTIQEKLYKPFGSAFEPELILEIFDVGKIVHLEPETEIIRPGQYLSSIPLILKGVVKILRSNAKNEEMFLYHLESGETCAISMACCTAQVKSEIRAVSETESEIIMIPTKFMEQWSSKYKSWRTFILNSYHQRLMQQYESIDTLAFSNLEERLMKYLNTKAEILKTNPLSLTHREIAEDLNTNRVVISRILKKLENQNFLSLDRNYIKLL